MNMTTITTMATTVMTIDSVLKIFSHQTDSKKITGTSKIIMI